MTEIRRVLVLSTAHLKQNTMLYSDWPVIATHEYGMYVFVGKYAIAPDHFNDPEDYPSDLYACLLFAKEHNCDEIKFDSDGPKAKELPVYDW